MKIRLALAVILGWTLVGVVWGSQMTFGASLQGDPVSFRDASRTALINALSWIPATLVVVAVTLRYPIRRATWRHSLWIHLLTFPAAAFLTHVFVVLGFWALAGSFQGMAELAGNAAFWTSMRIHIALLVYLVIAGATQAIQHYRAGQARELRIARLEGQLARARMDALNAQLRPHFLFNTLHTIGHLWRTGRADEADGLLDHLGSLFERVQATTSEPLVQLAEEIRMVEDYVAIEAARFPDRLRVSVDAGPDTLTRLVPPLMLQPLVENAIRHGVSQSSAAGRVRVAAHTEGDELSITVEDDGPGIRDDAPSRGTGTGISNLRQRLDELYGPRGTLTVTSRAGAGTLVEVRMPALLENGFDTFPETTPPTTAGPPGRRSA